MISLGEAIPANHLARFVVDIVAQLDLSEIYKRYAMRGGEPIAPEALLALVFYGYSTGKFSSRKIEKATYEDLGFRFVAVDCIQIMTPSQIFVRRFYPNCKGCSFKFCSWPNFRVC